MIVALVMLIVGALSMMVLYESGALRSDRAYREGYGDGYETGLYSMITEGEQAAFVTERGAAILRRSGYSNAVAGARLIPGEEPGVFRVAYE